MSIVFGLDPVSLFLGFLIFIVFWKISSHSGKAGKINKIPGPMPFPLLGNIIELLEPRDQALKNMMIRQKKYGTFFRVWAGPIPSVIICKPEYIEILIKGNKHSEKSFFYKFLCPWLGTGLLTSHGRKWAVHRKLITPSFHFKVLQGFVEVFHENANILVNKLKEKADTGEEFDVYTLITMCTLDIICETAMGTKINAQVESENQYVHSVTRLSSLIVDRSVKLWLQPDFIYWLSSSGREFQYHLKIVQGFTDKVIKTRKESFIEKRNNDEKKCSFLDMLLESSMQADSSLLTDEELREEVETFMFEGHDTTASGIAWALSVLGCHPKIQEDCYQELKSIFEDDPDRIPTLGDLTEMKLLERVIKETLRMYPSVTSIGRNTEEDIWCGDYLVPKGTQAIIGIYAMHRNPMYYPDPDKFLPDRFLPENIMKRHPYSYLPFSAGPRNCIGQKFALFEEKVILSHLLRNYKFESMEQTEDTVQIPNLVLRPGKGIRMKIWKR